MLCPDPQRLTNMTMPKRNLEISLLFSSLWRQLDYPTVNTNRTAKVLQRQTEVPKWITTTLQSIWIIPLLPEMSNKHSQASQAFPLPSIDAKGKSRKLCLKRSTPKWLFFSEVHSETGALLSAGSLGYLGSAMKGENPFSQARGLIQRY